MRNSGIRISVLILLSIILLTAFQGQSQHRLVLLHPTVSNIESMVWMAENKIIDIPEVQLLGVYSSEEVYNYSSSEKYIIEHQLKNYRLLKIEGDIKPEEIYRENSCTPAFRKLFEESDAILFFGGPDIPAAIYGEEQHLLTVVTDPHRHCFETSLFFHLIGGGRNTTFRPFLEANPSFIIRAFCLGMQTMNVAAGGTLIQDIPQELYHKKTFESVAAQPVENQHRSYESPMNPLSDLFGGNFHPIIIAKKGYLKEIVDLSGAKSPKVLSYHHQAVGRVGSNLRIIASSMDQKIIEGLQHTEFKNVVGVQFHPEPSYMYKPETRFTTVPGSDFSPVELLEKSNSLAFHKQFWRDFSAKVESSKRKDKN